MATRQSRFLDLPTELRLMIYENTPTRTRRRTIKLPSAPPTAPIADTTGSFFVTMTCLSVTAILSTCKLVHNEATPIFKRLRQLEQEPVRLEIDEITLVVVTALFDERNFYTTLKLFPVDRIFLRSEFAHHASRLSSHMRALEIAFTPSSDPSTEAWTMGATWASLGCAARTWDTTCTVFCKGSLYQCVVRSGPSMPGLDLWRLGKNWHLHQLNGNREDGNDFGRRMKMVEMEAEEWIEMVEEWKSGMAANG